MKQKKYRGVVKWFNYSQGFGFIKIKNGDDVYFHYNDIKSGHKFDMEEGTIVEFRMLKLRDNKLYYYAKDVCVLSDGDQLLLFPNGE